MTEFEPNEKQKELIESHEGIYLVDAGAGTGKTYAVTERYAEILETRDVAPEDLLLMTFTRNAADEMQERIVNKCSYDKKELREAPISTFHSYCRKIIMENGFQIPQHLGINDSIASSTRLIENEVLEKQEFETFFYNFRERHEEYNDIFRVFRESSQILSIIKELAAKGTVPTKQGWYRNTEKYLDGSEEEFWKLVEEKNEPNQGKRGPTNSDLRSSVASSFRNKLFTEEDPGTYDFFEDKKVKQEYFREAFEEERTHLKDFVHDVYLEYLEYCLSRNYINFNFLVVFAYVLLTEEESLRNDLEFDYVMIDEFQDTNEIQLKIAMLLSTGNICAVGDWKQSIYSFQYTDVDNIRFFEERLERYKEELNNDRKRISYPIEVDKINLKINYRSTQDVLDFSEQSLVLPATKKEEVDSQILEDVTSLEADKDSNSKIEALVSDDEVAAVLTKMQEVVGNNDYELEDGEIPSYNDVAVLTRNRKFGLKLRKKAKENGVPVAYEGGVKLFSTKPAKILLAWLRVLDNENSYSGWSLILERAGYNFEEIRHITREEDYPREMIEFREELEDEKVSTVAKKVFRKYGLNNGFTDKITEVLQNTFDSSYKNTGELIRFIEDCIEDDKTYEVDSGSGEAFTIQTIHSAKGLEYPIVFISDINNRHFPSTTGDSSPIIYDDTIGIRNKKKYVENEKYVFDNWKGNLTSKVLSGEYDEERRLMYVAMTRAEDHLFFTAEKENESPFFETLSLEPNEIEPEIQETNIETENKEELQVEKPMQKAPVKRSVHATMDLDETAKGRGPEYGTKVHEFAEKYAKNPQIEPSDEIKEDAEKVMKVIDNLDGELRTEVPIKVPVQEDGRKKVYHGKIDLLHTTDDKVQIIDWKTDLTKENHEEYQKQLKIYEKGIKEIFEDKEAEKMIFYTS